MTVQRFSKPARAAIVLLPCGLFLLLYGRVLFAPADHVPILMPRDDFAMACEYSALASSPSDDGPSLWNPYRFCGMPLSSSGRLGVLYPPNWLYAVVPTGRAVNLLLVAHALFAAVGVTLYCRGRRRSTTGAVLAGIAYALSGPIMLRLCAGEPHVAYSAAWLPFIFWILDRTLKKPGIAGCCCLAASLACQFLASSPEISVWNLYLLPTYLIFGVAHFATTCNRRWLKELILVGGAMTLAVILASAQVFPKLEYVQASHRGSGAAAGSLPPESLLTLLNPGLLGDNVSLPFWGNTTLAESSLFCGVCVAGLAAIAVISLRDREVWYWAFVGVTSILVSLGWHAGLVEALAAAFPAVTWCQNASRVSVVAILSLTILAARGYDHVFSQDERLPARVRGFLGGIAVAGIIALVGAGLERSVDAPPPESWARFHEWDASRSSQIPQPMSQERATVLSQSYGHLMVRIMVSGGVLIGFALSVSWRAASTSVSRMLVLGLACVELIVFARPYLQTSSTAVDREASQNVSSELSRHGVWRFCCVTTDIELLNQFVYSGLQEPGGNGTAMLTRYSALFRGLTGTEPAQSTTLMIGAVHERLFDLLNVQYYAAAPSAPRIGDCSDDRLLTRGVFEKRGVSYDLYENVDVLPRAFVVHAARQVPDARFGALLAPALLTDGPQRSSFVEGELPFPLELPSADAAAQERCSIRDWRPSSMTVDVTLAKPGLLMVCENYYPGWIAEVDGAPADAFPANLTMRAVPVPAGRHTIRMTFRPASVRWGRRISMFGITLVTVLLGYAAVRRRNDPVSFNSDSLELPRRSDLSSRKFAETACRVVYYTGGIALFFLLGGWIHLLQVDEIPPPGGKSDSTGMLALASVLTLLAVVGAGWRMWAANRRRLAFGTTALALLFPLTLLLAEGVARVLVPAWPVLGLHGVNPETVAGSWANVVGGNDVVGLNSWGQRDRPRARLPAPGVQRIAFVGDSFLEESATVPLSLRVEQRLARSDVEVINLGVSATGPEEYYYRARNIALEIGAKYCVVFLFSGNDFVEAPQVLKSFSGIAAVYPRDSFFSECGLLGINHLLTNRKRPVIQAWLSAGDLRREEEYLRLAISTSSDETLPNLLRSLGAENDEQRARLNERLSRPEMQEFYQMLQSPDAGQFRSYYLIDALRSAATGKEQWAENSEQIAFYWVNRTFELCRRNNVHFTLVIVPEAFQVDPRIVQLWKPLTDMRRLTRPCQDAAIRLRQLALDTGIDVIDLHEVLMDVPGTYLNLDGHWSDKGVEVVSEYLAKELPRRLAAERK